MTGFGYPVRCLRSLPEKPDGWVRYCESSGMFHLSRDLLWTEGATEWAKYHAGKQLERIAKEQERRADIRQSMRVQWRSRRRRRYEAEWR